MTSILTFRNLCSKGIQTGPLVTIAKLVLPLFRPGKKRSALNIHVSPFVASFRLFCVGLPNLSLAMDCSKTNVSKPFTVFVEGNIGSGKTTFLNHFSKYDTLILAEPVELWRNVRGHNMLDLMYKDPTRWSLAFQTIVQKTMLDLHIRQTLKPVKMIERSIYSARYCFVENLHRSGMLSSPDYAVLDEWFQWIIKNMDTRGDLIVYLRTDPEVVHRRIKARARSEEAQVPLEYLRHLHQAHEDWLMHKTAFSCPIPVVVVDANKDLSIMSEEYEKCETAMINKGSVFTFKQMLSPSSPSYQKVLGKTPTKVVL